MPLPAYGALIGTLNHYEREAPDNFGKYFHGFLYVDAPAGQYKCAVDVATPSGINVEHRQLHGLDAALFVPVSSMANGWHLLARNDQSGALDYVRSPILNKRPQGCMFVMFNWLTDLLNRIFISWQDSGWIMSDGENALNAMESLFGDVARIYVFGAPFTTGLGVHDIHMNQGDPPGQFQHLDAIWQDGAVVVETTSGQLSCFLTKFETQSLNTDNNGLPVP
jgi:hypothetical protein